MSAKQMKPPLFIAIIAVVLLGMISSDAAEWMNDERPIAFVRKFKPQVEVANFPKLEMAQKGEPLYNGDTLRTDSEGYAAVQFMDKSIAKVKPQSQLIVNGEVEGPTSASTRIFIETGEILLNVVERSTNSFEVATSSTVASVKGTEFGARADDYYWVLQGVVEMLASQSGEVVLLTERTFGRLNPDGTISTGELNDDDLAELNRDFDDLDDDSTPKVIKLRFRDQNGQIKEVDIEYIENQEQE